MKGGKITNKPINKKKERQEMKVRVISNKATKERLFNSIAEARERFPQIPINPTPGVHGITFRAFEQETPHTIKFVDWSSHYANKDRKEN